MFTKNIYRRSSLIFLGGLFIIFWTSQSYHQNILQLRIFDSNFTAAIYNNINFSQDSPNESKSDFYLPEIENVEFAAYSAYFDPKSVEITILGFKQVYKSASTMICVIFYRSVPDSDELFISNSDGEFQLINILTKNSHDAFYLRCPFRYLLNLVNVEYHAFLCTMNVVHCAPRS